MGRGIEKLKALTISRPLKRGYYSDGGGLYLQVATTGAKSWVFRYRREGRLREMGLGPFHTVSLAQARDLARTCRAQLCEGLDPLQAREKARIASQLAAAQSMTFRECAEAYIKAHEGTWRNEKHKNQWSATLGTYAYPVFGSQPASVIDISLLMKVLDPIWQTKPETASRLRGRIEVILDWATVRRFRIGDNPARWKGNLDKLLPAQAKFSTVKHHAALPYSEIGSFISKLREQEGIAAAALEFSILTAARTGETIGATWSEINLETRMWRIPSHRMKAGKEHRVPLSGSAISILKRMEKLGNGLAIYPGQRSDGHLSNMAMLSVLKRMKRPDLTTHGFRSTFRDWVAERTYFPREVAEMAMAHSISNQVEAAYRRGDLLEKRREMMALWATYCDTPEPKTNIISISGGEHNAERNL